MNALAITDHGNLYGALEFYQGCRDAGINPIVGYEAYVAPGSRFEKSGESSRDAAYHLTLLAQNRTGFNNLVKLSSRAFLEGFYHKPRIDRELLAAHSEGIICLSGCVSRRVAPDAAGRQHGRRGDRQGPAKSPPGSRACSATATSSKFRTTASKSSGRRWSSRSKWPSGWGCRRWPRATPTTCGRRMPSPRTCCSASTRASSAPTRIACGWRATSSTSAARRKCTRRFTGLEDAVARSQQIADTVDIQLELGKRHFPAFQLPPDENVGRLSARAVRSRAPRAVRGRPAPLAERRSGNRASSPRKCGSGSTASWT